MTFIRNPNTEIHTSRYAQPTHVEAHNGNPQYIIRLPNGQHVSANGDGNPLLDAQGRMETWGGSDSMTVEQFRAHKHATDPHGVQTHYASMEDAAAAREELRARGYSNVGHVANVDEGAAARAELIARGLIDG
jgi:hypothetical protein